MKPLTAFQRARCTHSCRVNVTSRRVFWVFSVIPKLHCEPWYMFDTWSYCVGSLDQCSALETVVLRAMIHRRDWDWLSVWNKTSNGNPIKVTQKCTCFTWIIFRSTQKTEVRVYLAPKIDDFFYIFGLDILFNAGSFTFFFICIKIRPSDKKV